MIFKKGDRVKIDNISKTGLTDESRYVSQEGTLEYVDEKCPDHQLRYKVFIDSEKDTYWFYEFNLKLINPNAN